MRIRIIIVIELYTKWLIMDEPTGFYLITYSKKPFHKSSTLQIVVNSFVFNIIFNSIYFWFDNFGQKNA